MTNTWTELDKVSNGVKYYYQNVQNNFFRNDNWFNTIKFSLIYSNSLPSGSRDLYSTDRSKSFKEFGKIINKENYNNIYVIINESYPNFRNETLKNNLIQKIYYKNDDIKVQNFKKKWNRSVTTQGSEMEFFCNKKNDFDEFSKMELNKYIEKYNCWIKNYKNKNLIYIHSYDEYFFNRSRYKSFFNKTYFKDDLINLGLQKCDQKFDGICDHQILGKLDNLLMEKNNNFVVFLTVNNHIPAEPIAKKKYIDCSSVFPLNLNNQFCTIYNNQMYFNENLSKFLNKIKKNDLVIFFSDTPPMFNSRRRIHFEDEIDIFFFSKK